MNIETFSHYQNILQNIEDLPINSFIDSEVDYYIAGGYAMALIFAPRDENLFIQSNYYDDIDVYFAHEKELNLAINAAKQREITVIEETTEWFVFKMVSQTTNMEYTFQFMKKIFSTQPAFFMNYDLLNCCLAFSARSNQFFFKDHALESTVSRQIEINNTFNFTEETALKFSYRINKFASRYKMKISDNLHSVLLYALIKNKNFKTTKDWNFRLSWSTDEMEEIPKDFNIWTLYRYAFSTNQRYTKYINKYFKQELQ